MSDYKLVPVEPTDEMIGAARESHEGEAYLPVSLYKAMLAAAPAVQGEPVALAASAQKPVGYVSQDFLDGKWNLDHIAKSDEGQISRTIPVFAKPPQPAEQQPVPDVSALVEALEQVIKAAPSRGPLWHGSEQIVEARAALSAHREQQGGALAQSGRGGDAGNQETDM